MEVCYNIISKTNFKMEHRLYLSGWPDWPELGDSSLTHAHLKARKKQIRTFRSMKTVDEALFHILAVSKIHFQTMIDLIDLSWC